MLPFRPLQISSKVSEEYARGYAGKRASASQRAIDPDGEEGADDD